MLARRGGDPVEHGVGDLERVLSGSARQKDRELVAAEPERFAALPEPARNLCQHAVSDRMTVAVVDLLEVVDVDEADRDGGAVLLRLVEAALQPLVEVAVVSEPREGIGEREPHRLQRLMDRALVQGDCDERTDESGREKRRPIPENGEHEAHRGHDRKRDERPVDRLAEHSEETLSGPDGDNERDE